MENGYFKCQNSFGAGEGQSFVLCDASEFLSGLQSSL